MADTTTLATKFKERIEKELEELLNCDSWNSQKLEWVYQLSDIMKDIYEMEKATSTNNNQ